MAKTIKVIDLEEMFSVDVKDDDVIMLDTGKDTYKLNVGALKAILSSDNKIAALKQNFEERLTEVSDLVDEFVTTMVSRVESVETTIQTVLDNTTKLSSSIAENEKENNEAHSALKDEIQKLETFVKRDLTNTISKINNDQKELATVLDEVIEKVNNDGEFTKTLDTKLDDYHIEVVNLQSTIESLKEDNRSNLDSISDSLKEYIDSRINNLKEQIDYWHHNSDNH